MKKTIKRVISVLLSLLIVFGTVSVIGFASDDEIGGNETGITEEQKTEEPGTEEPGTEEPGTEEPGTEEPGTDEPEEPKYNEDTVALFYLCSNNSGFPSLGHIWIYIENVSDHPLMIGAYDLPVGEGVSIGVFGLTRSDGAGTYYNVESYTYNLFKNSGEEEKMKKVKNLISLCGEANEETINKISNKIRNLNWWDPIIFNCVTFAVGRWNQLGLGFIFPWTVFPGITRLNIKRRHATGGLEMFAPRRDQVFKQIGRGDNASLRVVKDGTVDTPPG